MTKNLGWLDRLIRGFLGAILVFLGVFTYHASALGIFAIFIGAIILLTSALGFCPLYRLLRIRTRNTKLRV